jgi:hypothetical protein
LLVGTLVAVATLLAAFVAGATLLGLGVLLLAPHAPATRATAAPNAISDRQFGRFTSEDIILLPTLNCLPGLPVAAQRPGAPGACPEPSGQSRS